MPIEFRGAQLFIGKLKCFKLFHGQPCLSQDAAEGTYGNLTVIGDYRCTFASSSLLSKLDVTALLARLNKTGFFEFREQRRV